MSSRPSQRPVSIDLPTPREDRPSWAKVGIVAVVGFVIGVAWPKLAGVRLGPSAPAAVAPVASTDAPSNAPVVAKEVPRPASLPAPPAAASVANLGATNPSPSSNAVTAPPGGSPVREPDVTVKRGVVLSCKTADAVSLKGKECGELGLDEIVLPKIKTLAKCPQALGLEGKLSVILGLDFDKAKMSIQVGKSSTVGNVDSLGHCLRVALDGVKLKNVRHEQPVYSVAYSAFFGDGTKATEASSSGKAPSPGSTLAAAGDTTDISWDVAMVREAPRTGKIVARLPKGTKVKTGALKEGWIPIQYGDGFSSEGWIYRGAVGR